MPPSRSEGAAIDTSETGPSTSSRARGRRGAATPAASEKANIVILGPRDTLVGTLTVEGDVRIEGTVDGEVTATGEVTVHVGGTARARISARDIVVLGAVEGTVVGELVTLGDTASFAGEVLAGRLRVDEGAVINATIAMTAAGEAPVAHNEEHDDETPAGENGSAIDGDGDHEAYGAENAGSEFDAYSEERTEETSGVSSGADSEEG
jgi:cytoskeletal protein CcmA (bactofilin family)